MSRGHQRERDQVNALRADGWIAGRAPASLGEFDVWASRADLGLHLIEVKSTAASPFSDFGPQDRADLLDVARRAGALPWLWWNPPGRRPAGWYPFPCWPGVVAPRGCPPVAEGEGLTAALASLDVADLYAWLRA